MRNFFISLFFAASLCAQAQTRIAVLTNTHVMAPELLKSDGTAWQSYLASDRKLVDYSQRLFDTMVDRIRNEIRPDLVLITGDISKDGEALSHQYVVSKLDILRSAGIPTLVIPGNHDLGTSNAKVYDGNNATSAEVATASSFTSLYANYGYGDASLRDPNSLSYVTEPFNGLVIVGIDSGKNGVVSSSTLSWITSQVALAKEKGKQIIAMMHHPLFPHFSGVESFVNTSVVADYASSVGSFSVGMKASEIAITTSTPVALSADGGMLMMLPQSGTNSPDAWNTSSALPVSIETANTTGSEQSYIEVVCKVHSGDMYVVGTPAAYGSIYIPFKADWAVGCKYTYTLSFGSGAGGFNAIGKPLLSIISYDVDSMASWAEVETSTLPKGTNPVNNAAEIL